MMVAIACRPHGKDIPRHYDFGADYEFVVRAVERDGTLVELIPAADTTGDHFHDSLVAGAVVPEFYGFWVDVTNKSSKPIRFLWPDVHYVDEMGQAHTVYHYVIGER